MLRFCCLLLLSFSCTTGEDPSEDLDFYEGPVHGQVAGLVTTLEGDPVEGVDVSIDGYTMVSTNSGGTFVFEDVEPSDKLVVEYSKKGFAKNYAMVSLSSWETVSANSTLLEIDGSDTFNGSDGGLVEVAGVRANFPADSLIDSWGNTYGGQVTAEVTYVDPHEDSALGTPGDLSALAFKEDDGTARFELVQLVSYGMVDITLYTDDDKLLTLADGVNVPVSLPISNGQLPDSVSLAGGDVPPAWSFSASEGRWVQESPGEVVSEDEGLRFEFNASHFSWWNCDQGFVPTCATGRVVDVIGFPVRGASVRCAGGQTTSVVVADDDGYYNCSVLAGDSVTVTGATFVGNRNWSKSEGEFFIDGSTSSASECQPLPDIQIDVCRITGAVAVDNLSSIVKDNEARDADHMSALFWYPPGPPELCDDPWEALAPGDCWVGDSEEITGNFPESAVPGIPENARSAGSWIEIAAGESYRIDEKTVSGKPYYDWNSVSLESDDLVTDRPDIHEDDVLDVFAQGNFSSYFGPWQNYGFATVPTQTMLASTEVGNSNVGSSLTQTYTGNDDDTVVVFGALPEDQLLMCRFDDDGSFTLRSSLLNGVSEGVAGLGVYHLDVEISAGPDGLPIRSVVTSGQTKSITINR